MLLGRSSYNSSKDYALSKILKGLKAQEAKDGFLKFVQFLKPDYQVKWFHELICKKLDDFAAGKIRKLMVFMPPQHGKSELTTRKFPAYLIGKKPELKIAVVTYSDGMSNTFNRAIQRTIDSPEYLLAFPNVKLNDSKLHYERQQDKQRNTDILDILFTDGSIRTLGRGGALTGNPVDVGIIDDPLKDREEALSDTIKNKLWEWYTDVFKTRLHNDSQQLIIQTRWDQDDLAGKILEKEDDWDIVILPAICTEDKKPYDPRAVGEALWPEKHSLETIRLVEKNSIVTFNSLYQQDPKPNSELLIHPNWIEADSFPDSEKIFWGIDYGYTNDPTAIVKVVREGECVYLKECSYEPGISNEGIKAIFLANGYRNGQPIYSDVYNDGMRANAEQIAALRRMGLTVFLANKSIKAGILKLNEFKVFYTGANFRKEVKNYKWVAYGEVITNEPEDKNNHLCDAARYAVYTHYFGR